MALMQITYLSIGSVPTITQVVARELSRYNYTFLTSSNVSMFFFSNSWLISFQGDPLRVVPIRSKPYRNSRIIAVLRDLCFTGGATSIANRFSSRFPTSRGDDGREVREMPVVMVALVATAVSVIFLRGHFVLTHSQLYTSIHEWHTGRYQTTEFSANAYLDVYNGHIQTFRHISENKNGVFHRMMSDIYAMAR